MTIVTFSGGTRHLSYPVHMTNLLRSAIFALAAGAAVAAIQPHSLHAQGLDSLPNRPIARSEVVAVVRHQFTAMDANRDGVVTQAEFARFRDHQPAAPAGGIDALAHVGGHWFEHADSAGNGRVTLAEAEARPLRMFDLADANRDGVVSLAERQMATTLMALTGK